MAAIDKLRQEGREQDAVAIEESLDKSIDGGFKKAQALGAILTPIKKESMEAVGSTNNYTGDGDLEPLAENSQSPEASAVSNVRILAFPKKVLDLDAALEGGDKIVTFLRSPAAKHLTPQQHRTLAPVIMQIVKFGQELGLNKITDKEAA